MRVSFDKYCTIPQALEAREGMASWVRLLIILCNIYRVAPF